MNTPQKAKPQLFIIITAYKSEEYIEQTLDSIFQEISKNKNIQCSVLLGIDSCPATELTIKKIAHKYGNKLSVYKTLENSGTYLLRNSLLKLIKDKDSIVFFFDSDDIIPSCFLKYYYNYIRRFIAKNDKVILRTMFIGIPDRQLTKSQKVSGNRAEIFSQIISLLSNRVIDGLPELLAAYAMRSMFENKIYRLIYSAIRLTHIRNSDTQSLMSTNFKHRSPHGSFFATYSALETLGFFNKFRVGQDTDILNRADRLNIQVILNKKTPPFFRRISESSLTNSSQYGHGSKYRNEVIAMNSKLIEEKKFVAPMESVTLVKIV